MFVTVDGWKAWLVGDQPRWRRFMTREMTRRGLLGWGIASVVAFILTYDLLGNDEAAVERIFVSLTVSVFIGMLLMIWMSIKDQVKPGPDSKLFYMLTTPIWHLVMVPTVVEHANEPHVKSRINNVFDYWREYFESIPVARYYPNWLLEEAFEHENDELFERLWRLGDAAGARDEMAEEYDRLLRLQFLKAEADIEEKLSVADNEFVALENEWNRLEDMRTSM